MKRAATIVLVAIGLLSAALAFSSYNAASDDANLAESICRLGGGTGCDAAMDWSRPGLFSVVAVVAFGSAWLVGRSGSAQRAEDLVD
jgi:hypothetical protein